MSVMEYLILTILALIIFMPLFIPWGKKLLAYCIITWFALWALFIYQMERESSPTYDHGIFTDSMVVILCIVLFIIVVSFRSLAQFIWNKFHAKHSHT